MGHMRAYERYVKRVIDVVAACAGLIVLAPLMMLIALAIRYKMGSRVLFTQIRPGKDGQPFCLYKFRTMTAVRDSAGQLLSDAERLTRFGKWLRSSSLDELPELWNVLRGDMSLVGPRPLLMDYLPHYNAEQARRHDVRPGLTGWAQVQGRNATTWAERLQQDAWYVDHVSWRLDMYILWRTVSAVATRRGITAEGHATMPRFDETSTSRETHAQAA
jgi:lipopolysaccharide/colanic/teichoic acid biosynthesis glycosyltransferase